MNDKRRTAVTVGALFLVVVSSGMIIIFPTMMMNAAFAANIDGTNRDDRLRGTSSSDTIRVGGGNDLIYGRAGSDELYGGRGDDRIYGQRGNDNLYGWYGTNLLDGGAGRDTIYATGLVDRDDPEPENLIYGRDGSDRVILKEADARVHGGKGNDRISATSDSSEYTSVLIHGNAVMTISTYDGQADPFMAMLEMMRFMWL